MRKQELLKKFELKGLTLGSVESLTGGLFAAAITSVPGASIVFRGALITYDAHLKYRIAEVSHDIIEKRGVISGQCARDMAENGLRILDVDVCISLTGNAGPSALEGKPVGLVYIGLSIKDRTTIVQKYKFQGNREEIRSQSVQAAIDLIYTHLGSVSFL